MCGCIYKCINAIRLKYVGIRFNFFFLPENQNDFKPKIKATEHQQLKTNVSTDSYRILTLQNSCSRSFNIFYGNDKILASLQKDLGKMLP